MNKLQYHTDIDEKKSRSTLTKLRAQATTQHTTTLVEQDTGP